MEEGTAKEFNRASRGKVSVAGKCKVSQGLNALAPQHSRSNDLNLAEVAASRSNDRNLTDVAVSRWSAAGGGEGSGAGTPNTAMFTMGDPEPQWVSPLIG